jgi:hypothetical protein
MGGKNEWEGKMSGREGEWEGGRVGGKDEWEGKMNGRER